MLDPDSEFIRRAITLDNYTTCVHTDAAAVRERKKEKKKKKKKKRRKKKKKMKRKRGKMLFRAQELCESRGGRPGLPSLIRLRFLWT